MKTTVFLSQTANQNKEVMLKRCIFKSTHLKYSTIFFCCKYIHLCINRNCHILIIWVLAMTLTLKVKSQFFHMTLLLMIIHYHTKFGSKMFCSSEDTVLTNIHWHFEPSLLPWPWIQQSNFFTEYSSLWWCTMKPGLAESGSAI